MAKKKKPPPKPEPKKKPEVPPLGDHRWEVILTERTEPDERFQEWLILKSFMLKQQELLEQLQADFGYWLRRFTEEIKRAKEESDGRES